MTELSISQLKTELERGCRMFKAFEKGVEVIAALEGLEQTAQAMNKAASDAAAKKEKAEADLLEQMKKADGVSERTKAMVVSAQYEAETLMMGARAEAAMIIDTAKNAIKMLDAELSAKKQELSDIASERAAKKLQVDALNDALASATKKLEALLK